MSRDNREAERADKGVPWNSASFKAGYEAGRAAREAADPEDVMDWKVEYMKDFTAREAEWQAEREAWRKWWDKLQDHAPLDLSAKFEALLACGPQPLPEKPRTIIARHATETALDFESEIEYLKELERKAALPASTPEDEQR